MLSKALIKFIKSLQIKKYRKQEQCFIVQGQKSVAELLLADFEVRLVIGTPDYFSTAKLDEHIECIEASENELQRLGEFQSNDRVMAVARILPNRYVSPPANTFSLVLDDIRDPGNLGTIIRTADWYGIANIIASNETADFYNPKVISATMGSFTRVNVYYTDLPEYLAQARCPVYGAYLGGENIHSMNVTTGGLILIGNESRGISPELESFVTQKVTIPRFGKAESLNAAIATAIICDNFIRGTPPQ